MKVQRVWLPSYSPDRCIQIPRGQSTSLLWRKASKGTKYLTLSHRCGGDLSLRLLESNLSAMEDAISFKDLPKTFQDAVKVVGI